MRLNPATFRALALGILGAFLLSGTATAAEVRVMISGGLTAPTRRWCRNSNAPPATRC